MADARMLPDKGARIRALTELDRSMLVEAGAGSGKTSIMAGRVAMLFACGVEPKSVAAITFTEFAASELMIRISRFVSELRTALSPGIWRLSFRKASPSSSRQISSEREDRSTSLSAARSTASRRR